MYRFFTKSFPEEMMFNVQCALVMLFVRYLFCFLSLLANHRTPSEGEAYAFRTLYSTDDMTKLKEIEQKPLQFWQERENALMQKGATISHLEFCARFVQEAKDCILKDCPEELKGSCQQRFIEIDHIMEEMLPGKSPILPNAMAHYYSTLCDKVHKAPQGIQEILLTSPQINLSDIHDIVESYSGMTHEFNERVRWIVSKDGQFSIFDWLVMRRNGYYLCGAPEDPQARFGFSAHGKGFTGWEGLFEHDASAHSFRQHLINEALKNYSISDQEYFNTCCNPELFIAGDLIGMSHKILGWFYQFHELPSLLLSYKRDVLCSLIFPHPSKTPGTYFATSCWRTERNSAGTITDPGFLDIAPYFMHVPLKYDWHTHPLPRHPIPNKPKKHAHQALLGWSTQHCIVGFEFLPAKDMLEYFSVSYAHFSFITPTDLQRDSHFFSKMLISLYKAEQQLAPTERVIDLSDFEKNVEADVQEFLRMAALLARGDILMEAPSYFIFVLSTKYAAQCQQITDKRINLILKNKLGVFHPSFIHQSKRFQIDSRVR